MITRAALWLCLFALVFAVVIPVSMAQAAPCAAITRNPKALDALLDSYSKGADAESDTTITLGALALFHFNPIVIQPGDALYVEYRGEPFDLTAHFANGDVIGFDSASKAQPDQWRKGIYPLDMFGRGLNQQFVGLTAMAKNPAQVSLRNIRIVRAGKPVFEFVQLSSYGRPEVKMIGTRKLPCKGNDEYPNVTVAYAEANRFAATSQLSTPAPAREIPGTPAPAPLTLTVQQINSLVLHNAPPIQAGDNLLMRVNRTDFSLEILLTHQKNIMNVHPPEGAQPRNGWIGGRIKLDRPGIIGERIIGMKVRQVGPGGAPLSFRIIQLEREGRVILALDSRPEARPEDSGFEPPMSYPPDPMTPNPHVTNVSLSRSDVLGHQPDTGFLAPKLPSYSISPMMFQSTTTSTGDPNHYKFQGKELDAETGLYNFGARYYNPALSRYMSPDWSARPAAVPFADLSNPQTLNLYTFGRNNPTSLRDSDGHCVGDDCSDVKVGAKEIAPAKIVTNEKTDDGTFVTGVRAKVQYTITVKDKALSKTLVHEDNKDKATFNGNDRQPKLNQQDSPTNSQGQVNDTYGLLTESEKPLQPADANGLAQTLSNNAVTQSGTQTLTFTTPGGTTCSCTVDRTITNENKGGTNNGANYTFKTSQPTQPVKATPQPKDKQQQ